ncbi:MAG: DNA-processing protein DprA [Chloroflexota bacterium]
MVGSRIVADEERAYWVALSMAAGIGPIRFQRLLEMCGDVHAAWAASDLEMAAAGLERRTMESLKRLRRTTSPAAELKRLQLAGIHALTIEDEEYPANVREVVDPPPVLFVRGHILPRDVVAVALIGTRRATPYGRAVADRLTTDLVAAGVTIVSGLARGVDTVVHTAAVRARGRTLAVLGNGLDTVYPPENGPLARQIVECDAGALVSEFPPGVPPDAVNFPRRNRIIAGLSRISVVIEAGERSGALITADFALEQGRDVMVVPGPIFSPQSIGTNALLKQGAIPVTGAGDILVALSGEMLSDPPEVARQLPILSAHESAIWEVLGAQPHHADELARTLRLPANEVSATLALLELKGLARQVGSMVYTRP